SEIRSFIFFDLETSGLHKSAGILQIAAKCGESTFSEYANPSQPITPSATAITGLRNVAGELFLYDKRLPSIPIHEVLQKFKEWLDVFKPCILVAHNAKFDTPRLLYALKKNSMVEDFKNIIVAFADTLVILRKLHPQRKGPGMFKLSRLAEDLLHIEPTTKFHEASYDVDILEKIASTIPKEKLIANSKSFTECFVHEACLQKTAVLERSLNVFKGVISAGMIKKIASAGIDNTKIQKVYAESGRDGIVQP
ncbi:DNA polymerase III PolC-type-like, partial [Venturia canescens]|uniref:DNA polymerase III PolC-type-like n=1 Tax=Venturia canescens TaxID=32260 RepID=UPI001C9BEEE7